jgi:hypothetical protein
MKIEEFIEHTNQLMAMGLANIEGLPLIEIKNHAERQVPRDPIHDADVYRCPHCQYGLFDDMAWKALWHRKPPKRCDECGQVLKWIK